MTAKGWYYVIDLNAIKPPIFFYSTNRGEALKRHQFMTLGHLSDDTIVQPLSIDAVIILDYIIKKEDKLQIEDAKKNGYTNPNITVENGALVFPEKYLIRLFQQHKNG